MGSTRGRGRRSWSAPRVAAENNSKTRPQATYLEGGEERSETAAEREQWKTQHKPTTGPGIKYPPVQETKSPVTRGKKIRKSLGLLQPFPGAVASPWKDLWEERHHRWCRTPVLSVGLPSTPFEYKFQKLAGTRIIFSLVPLSPTNLRRQKGTVKEDAEKFRRHTCSALQAV